MSPPTYAPSAGRMVGGRARVHATPRSVAATSGSTRATGMNGATPSGSGSMPSASSTIVALPASAIS